MSTEAAPAAVARALTKRYSNGVVALDRLDLEIRRASITALIGNNGSGKTTLSKILAGLLKPDSGSVRTLGRDPAARTPWLRARLGYVSQAAELDPEMTARETLDLFAHLYALPAATRRERIASLAEAFGLTEHLPRLVSTLSGGLRQRLHLAIGLLHQPELLLLDEPTAALDPAGRAFVWNLLRQLSHAGRTIVVASHDLADVSRHCHGIALLHRGRLLASGSPAEVIAAHAQWRLEVELTGVEPDTIALERLASLPGLKNVSVRDRQVMAAFTGVEADAARRAAEAVLEQIARLNATVLGYRLHPPDLASAYFDLTGATLERNERAGRAESSMGTGRRHDRQRQATN